MSDATVVTKFSVGLHVHVYLWRSIAIIALALVVVVAILITEDTNPAAVVGLLAGIELVFVLALWHAVRRRSTPELSYWQGLLRMTSDMTVGIGGLSGLIAVPSTIAAVLASICISGIALFRPRSAYAPAAFRKMAILSYRHRMFQ